MTFEHVCEVWKLYVNGKGMKIPEVLLLEISNERIEGACILEAWLMEEAQ